jgi:hypothetical protein
MRPILPVILLAVPLCAQTYRVPLEIRNGETGGMYQGVEIVFDEAGHGRSAIPSGGELHVERMPAPLKGIIVEAADGDPSRIALLPGQWSRVLLPRTVGHVRTATYSIVYNVSDYGGRTHESIGWMTEYHAEGRLKLHGCEHNLAVVDFNADGVFDRRDSRQATTLAIDFDDDGHFNGNDWHMMAEILDVCGIPLWRNSIPREHSLPFAFRT